MHVVAADDRIGHVAGKLGRAPVGKRGQVGINEQGGALFLEACTAPVTCQSTSFHTHISPPWQSSVTCWVGAVAGAELGLYAERHAHPANSDATLPRWHLAIPHSLFLPSFMFGLSALLLPVTQPFLACLMCQQTPQALQTTTATVGGKM